MSKNIQTIHTVNLRGDGIPVQRSYLEQAAVVAGGLGSRVFGLLQNYVPIGGHISDRLRAEMPMNEARIGAQYVGIAAKTRVERIAKLRSAVTRVGLPHDEIAELDASIEQIGIGKKIAAKSTTLPLEVVDGMEKELVTRMEAVVREADLPTDEFDVLKRNIRTYSIVGHGAIAQAMLDAETAAFVPDDITLKTVNIARKAHTQPELLVPPGWLSEFEAARAEEIMIEAPTRLI